jgi:SAM-dependent methyltransferase
VTDFLNYDFGYTWYVGYGLLIPLALGAAVVGLALWRAWPRWITVIAGGVSLWAFAGLFLINIAWGINTPMELPTPRFLASGSGRVLDAGAGSGRAAIGVLLARPRTTVTGLDLYAGYFGIDDNTPDRFMKNARIAGVANRADTRTGDMRDMPFHDGEFDAVVSSYAIDHLRRDDLVKGLSEVARVLKPRGEFLVLLINPDWLTWVFAPPVAHHPRPDSGRWRSLLEQGGFAVVEEGVKPATLYFVAQKRTSRLERLESSQAS